MLPDDRDAQLRRFRRLSSLVRWMPRWMARAFATLRTRWVIARGDFDRVRDVVAGNLAPVLPPGADARAAAERTMRNYGQFLMDYFRIPAMTPKWMRSMFRPMVGKEHVEAALKAGKGAVLVSPHLGNWELGAIALRLQGLAVTVVGVPDPGNPAVSEWRDEIRRGHGIEVFNVAPDVLTPLELTRALAANRLVAMLGDRNFFESEPVEVELFGRRARFPRGPALVAAISGSPLLPAFVTLGTGGKYEAVIEAPIAAPQEGGTKETSEAMTRDLARRFEARIRGTPEQWYVFDPYWGDGEPVSNVGRGAMGLETGRAPLK